jgi:hypothetical protein
MPLVFGSLSAAIVVLIVVMTSPSRSGARPTSLR